MFGGLFIPRGHPIHASCLCDIVYYHDYIRVYDYLMVTFIMQRGYGSIFLLTCAVPKLKPYVHSIYHAIFKGKIVSDCGNHVLFVLLAFESVNEGCFSDCALSYKAHFDEFINVFHYFLLFEHLHQRMIEVRFCFIDQDLTYWAQHCLVSACLADCMATLKYLRSSRGGIVT
jgi:hypothetical protein